MQTKKIADKQNYCWYWKSENRYYSIRLQQNLFEEWTLLKSWGGLKNKLGRVKLKTYNSLNEALKEIHQTSNLRSKRKYILTSQFITDDGIFHRNNRNFQR